MRIANDIQQEIVRKKLNVALRTVCKRTAFQKGRDQSLRFSIDYNFHVIDELQLPRKKGKKQRTVKSILPLIYFVLLQHR
jgi:SPX domain protein involved in polyphosphate accumulation